MTFSVTDKEKKMIREILEKLSEIDIRSPEERVEQLLKEFKEKREIAGFLPKARYKELRGLLVIIAKKSKYDVGLVKIDGKHKTDEELEKELRKFLQQI